MILLESDRNIMIHNLGDGLLIGLSSDKKPLPAQVARGNRFIEINSDYSKFTMFICNGLQWIPQTQFKEEYENKIIDYNKNSIINIPVSVGGTGIDTASNVGVTGIGLFKQRTDANLEFYNVDIGSTKLTVVQDSINNTVTFDVVESNLRFDTGIKVLPITVPTTDASYGIYYSDSADTNKPKFKKPDGTVIDLTGAGSGVSLSAANTWTATQTISISGYPPFVLYRTDNTVGFGNGINIDLNNSSNAQINYAQLIGGIDTNTAGSEKGFASIALRHTGALRTTFKLNPDGTMEWGDPTTRYGKFSPSGLSAARVFTFPNSDAQLAGSNISNTFSATNTFSAVATFTAVPKVTNANFPLLSLYRTDNTVGFGSGISFNLNDSADNETTYAQAYGGIHVNTNGAEEGEFIISVRVAAGTLQPILKLNTSGIVEMGVPGTRYINFDPTGLSAGRSITFPNQDTLLAGQNFANTFTVIQKISNAASGQPLTLYRGDNTAGIGEGIYFNLNTSTSAEATYALIYGGIEVNTNGAHRGDLYVQLPIAGSLGTRFRIYTSGNGGLIFGNNSRIQIDETGLTGARIFTFPDATAALAGSNFSNVFTVHQQFDDYVDVKQISAPANPSANYGRMYLKQIDSNNDGLFMLVKKASGFVEVQII